eukprot:8710862-Alexandrium_andersonii.AAC.1
MEARTVSLFGFKVIHWLYLRPGHQAASSFLASLCQSSLLAACTRPLPPLPPDLPAAAFPLAGPGGR